MLQDHLIKSEFAQIVFACWFWFTILLFTLIIPVSLYFIYRKHPQWFSDWKIFCWPIGTAIFSWTYLNAPVLIGHLFGYYAGGPGVAFNLLFGWLYLWMAAFPVILIGCAIALIRKMIRKIKK